MFRREGTFKDEQQPKSRPGLAVNLWKYKREILDLPRGRRSCAAEVQLIGEDVAKSH